MDVVVVVEPIFRDRDIVLRDLLHVAERHPGNDVLTIAIQTPYGRRLLRATQSVDSWDPGLREELEELTGASLEDDD